MSRQEYRGRIGDLAQTLLHHGEHADLVGRAEAVLDRTQHPKAAAGVALEIQHRIDHVLEHARSGDLAFLGHVADQQHGGAAGLGKADQFGRAFAQLRDRAGSRIDALRIHRLDRIDDERPARSASGGFHDLLDLVSAISRASRPSRPRRRARRATCLSDSSPVAYSTGPAALMAAADCSMSVDLPMPGSPPIKVTEPGTRPPPSTRSSSPEPVESRGWSRLASSARRVEAAARAGAAVFRRAEPDACTSAVKVFHSPHAGHCPCHFGEEAPQFWQTNTSLRLRHGLPRKRFVSLALLFVRPITYTAAASEADYVYSMRKFGLISAIVGFGPMAWTSCSEYSCVLQPWPGFRVLYCFGGGGALFVLSRCGLLRRRPRCPGQTRAGHRHRPAARQLRTALRRTQGPKAQRHGAGRPVHPRHPAGAARPGVASHRRVPASRALRQYLSRRRPRACGASWTPTAPRPKRRRPPLQSAAAAPSATASAPALPRRPGVRPSSAAPAAGSPRPRSPAARPLPARARDRPRRHGHRIPGARYRHQSAWSPSRPFRSPASSAKRNWPRRGHASFARRKPRAASITRTS